MKAGILKTSWFLLQVCYFTLIPCASAIIYSLLGTLNRAWVDKTILKWSHNLLGIVQAKVEVFNPYQVSLDQHKPYILMCNHASLYDIPLSFLALPGSIRMLAKKELSRIPILGTAMKKAEFAFIDRHNHHQAMKDLSQVKKLMGDGIVIWIAPEGTRSYTGQLGKFKKGGFITAIEAKATIIPIGIRGANNILSAHSLRPNLRQTAEIHIGEPVDAGRYTLDQKDQLKTEIEHRIRNLIA